MDREGQKGIAHRQCDFPARSALVVVGGETPVDGDGEGNEDGVGNSPARSGARPAWSRASCSGWKRRLEMGAASVRVGDTSAARICGGKVRPTTLASAPEGEEKGGGQREISGA
jgi:hypothetical protein